MRGAEARAEQNWHRFEVEPKLELSIELLSIPQSNLSLVRVTPVRAEFELRLLLHWSWGWGKTRGQTELLPSRAEIDTASSFCNVKTYPTKLAGVKISSTRVGGMTKNSLCAVTLRRDRRWREAAKYEGEKLWPKNFQQTSAVSRSSSKWRIMRKALNLRKGMVSTKSASSNNDEKSCSEDPNFEIGEVGKTREEHRNCEGYDHRNLLAKSKFVTTYTEMHHKQPKKISMCCKN